MWVQRGALEKKWVPELGQKFKWADIVTSECVRQEKWVPELGRKFLLLIAELPAAIDEVIFDANVFSLTVGTEKSIKAVGIIPYYSKFNLGQNSIHHQDPLVFITKAGRFLLEGDFRPHWYGILFVVPSQIKNTLTNVQIQFPGSSPVPLKEFLPKLLQYVYDDDSKKFIPTEPPKHYLIGKGPNITFKSILKIARFVPHAERGNTLHNIHRSEVPPDNFGIVAEGTTGGFDVIVVRVPLRQPEIPLKIIPEQIVVKLEDNSTCRATGLIDRIEDANTACDVPVLLSGPIVLMPDGSIRLNKDSKIHFLEKYHGPETAFGLNDCKLAIAFPEREFYRKISTFNLGPYGEWTKRHDYTSSATGWCLT